MRGFLFHFLPRITMMLLLLFNGPVLVRAQFEFSENNGRDLASHSEYSFHFLISGIEYSGDPETIANQIFPAIISNARQFRFKERSRLTDQLGQIHTRWDVYYNDHLLAGVDVITHANDHGLFSVSGKHYGRIELPEVGDPFDVQQALQNAVQAIHAESYMWQSPEEESMLRLWEADPNASYFPRAVPVIVPASWEHPSEDLRSAWRFDIFAREPLMRYFVYVDQETGEVFNIEERIHVIDVSGKAETKYSGTQRITTDSLAPGSFRLRESSRGKGIETFNMKTGTSYAAAVDFTDSDNYWDNVNSNKDEVATDAHWGAASTYDYFWNKFGRNSYDGNGAKIRSYVHYSKNYNNAFWNGSVMTYGDGDGKVFTPLTALDVCGHEIAHAVTTNTANLVYSYESGALNESFSDIFGNSIEFYVRPAQFAWNIGEDITPSGTGIRLMQNPNSKGHPDTYKGTNWRTGTADNGGVHSNSGVQNFWYYLLCEGGSGTNDNSETYQVSKIGMNKAEQIAYRNLSVYLTASSQYSDARYFSIRSAADLYGACSEEVIAVTNAWHAVGVGEKYDSLRVTADFYGDTLFCAPIASVSFVNRSLNAKSFQWDFGNGKNSTAVNPGTDYTAYGSYDVTLIAEGCFQGVRDTMLKKAYVRVDSTIDICNGFLLPVGSYQTVRACKGFVYDNGGEDNYKTLVRDTLTIDAFPSDSIVLDFSVFDYEDKYDSVYIYDGPNTLAPRVGGYTGQTLPNGGHIVTTSGYVTIRHFSDPYVVGKGFKAKFQAYREPLSLSVSSDTTVCKGNLLVLRARGRGSYPGDTRYWWNGVSGDTVYGIVAERDTVIHVTFGDICLGTYLRDSIRITVLPELELDLTSDTTFCYLQPGVQLIAKARGGLPAGYAYKWLPTGSSSNPLSFIPRTDTTLKLILSDGCTVESDTANIQIHVLQPLRVQVSPDTILCEGMRATMRVEGEGGKSPYYFNWSHGLGNMQQVVNWVNVDTTYMVRLTDGCSGIGDSAAIRIRYLAPLRVEMSSDTAICLGTSADIYALASGGDSTNYSFRWTDGLPAIYRHNVSPVRAERYAVVLSDACSKTSVTDSVLVVVYPALTVSIIGPDTLCNGERVLLRGNVTGGRVSTYQFSWNGGLGNMVNANANPQQDTTYRLIVSDGCSENDTAFKSLIVREPLKLTLSPDASICNGDSITALASGSGGLRGKYNFFWDNGVGYGPSQILKPRFTTTYKVTLNDACSNYAEEQLTVTVHPSPNVSFYPNPTKRCVGEDIQFENTTPNISRSTFDWDFGDGSNSSAESPLHSYNSAGTYNVSLRVTNEFSCEGSRTSPAIVEILESPKAVFVADPPEADILNPEINFINQSRFADAYNWYFGDGYGDTNMHTSHSYLDTGYYSVELEVRNAIGCTDRVGGIVRIKDIVLLHIPNAFTPDHDEYNETFKPYVRGLRNYEFRVYDRWGELLFRTDRSETGWPGMHSDGTEYPMGVYWYTIEGLDVDRNKVRESGTFLLLR